MAWTWRFGVELEGKGLHPQQAAEVLNANGVPCRYLGYTHAVTPTWKTVTDASVRGGFELVSPILSGKAGLEELAKVCRVLTAAGARVDRSCGFHVHHDVRGKAFARSSRRKREAFMRRLAAIYARFEPALDALVAPSRRADANRYCRSMAYVNGSGAPDTADRYRKVNFVAFVRHGTVEFRHHQGTFDPEKAVWWVKLTHKLLSRAWEPEYLHLQPEDFPPTLDGLMDFLNAPKSMRAYFARRAAETGRRSAGR